MSTRDLFSNTLDALSDRPLIAYAFLAQAGKTSGDLLSGLAPIFKPIALERVSKPFNSKEFAEAVRSMYGIEIHPWAVEDLAPRLEAAGLLVKISLSASSAQYAYAEVEGDYGDVSDADIRLIVQRFVEFARPVLAKHELKADDSALEKALFEQLISMDFHSILLKPDKGNGAQKENSGRTLSLGKSPEKKEWEISVAAKARLDVLCASFIVDAFHTDRSLFDLVARIATGALVAETVLNIQDPGVDVNLNTLNVVLDAPFLMSLLDLASEESTIYARSLCEQLKQHGASLVVFRHSIEEMTSNLRAAFKSVEEGTGFRATSRRLGQTTFREYASSVLRSVDSAVTRLQIRIADIPTSKDAFSFFTEDDEQTFHSALGFYENPIAKQRDVSSVAAIMRLRRGKATKMGRFHQSLWIFITDNTRVAERAAQFSLNRKFRREDEVSPVLTDRNLSGLLFVLYGGKAADLTHYRLLANCTAALEPRSDVIRKMHQFLTQLDPAKAKHFRALMTDERAGQHMMQLTLGDSSLIPSTKDAEQILEQIEASLGEKHRKEFDERVATLTKSHESEVIALHNRQEQLSEEVRTSMADTLALKGELNSLKETSAMLSRALQEERQKRIDEKRLQVVRCMSHALATTERRHKTISMIVSTGITVVAIAGAELSTKSDAAVLLVGALTWVLTYLGFWKNPEAAFGSHLYKVRESAFIAKAEELGVSENLELFSIDWSSRVVQVIEQTGPAVA